MKVESYYQTDFRAKEPGAPGAGVFGIPGQIQPEYVDGTNASNHSERISQKTVETAIDRANKDMYSSGRKLEFSVHKDLHVVMVKVRNSETGELIREIPPEKILDLVANMCKMSGILVDEKR